MLSSLGSLAQVLLITSVDKTMGIVGYHIREGIQPILFLPQLTSSIPTTHHVHRIA
jgi:hypothetical protein